MLKKIFLPIFFIMLLFQGCGGTKVLNVKNEPVRKISIIKLEQAIQAGASRKGWTTKILRTGVIEATINKSNKLIAKVKITYNNNSYSIDYLDSKNFNYKDGKIHSRYNSWVANLKRSINAYAKKSSINTPMRTATIAPVPLSVSSTSGYIYNFKEATKLQPDSFALVIGISRYQQNTPVEYADASALAFAELANKTFGIPKENIITLINDEATSGQIKARFEIIKELADKRGNIYIYYAGHGVPGKDGNTYILPYDMSADSIYLEENLKLDNIYSKLASLKTKKVFVFMDSCFSGRDDKGGLLYRGVAPVLKTKKVSLNEKKLVLVTAGKSTDFANDFKDKGQRMFSYYLINELSSGNKNLNKVYEEVRSKVKRASILKGLGYKQIPQIYGDSKAKLY